MVSGGAAMVESWCSVRHHFLHSGIFELKVDGVVCYNSIKVLEEQLLVLCFKFLAKT